MLNDLYLASFLQISKGYYVSQKQKKKFKPRSEMLGENSADFKPKI